MSHRDTHTQEGCLTFLVMEVDFSCGGMAMLENGTSMEYLMECSS